MMYRNKKLRQFARGRSCTVRSPNCDGGGETSVWAHSNSQRDGKGMGIKAHDLFGCVACAPCHRWLDEGKAGRAEKERVFYEAMRDSLRAACEAGVL